ncbi:hypothetical protein jhhlp_007751 [Lomentospora prolificans]|uniref:Transcriptional regulator n=1 Tax=Lomentospora prolificans TaxID=41688 RepID=A0A2N3N0G3_9PEZI|nr:hypothetical protein jhhlp_007751 [Lomentospora prolificans]
MYLRADHVEDRIPVLHQLIRDYPLGIITTAISSPNFPLLQSSHIPWVLDADSDAADSDSPNLGRLRGHMARQNPQSKAIIEHLTPSASRPEPGNVIEQDVLVLFTATPHHYVTPKFYVETKPTSGKVVPTWNYAAVQVYGRARVYFDSKSDETSEYLNKQIAALSNIMETNGMGYTGENGRPGPWKVSDAPDNYVELLKKNIIGIEIEITKLEGKFKMSQEMSKGDREGVIQGFKQMESENAQKVSALVQERSDLKESRKK